MTIELIGEYYKDLGSKIIAGTYNRREIILKEVETVNGVDRIQYIKIQLCGNKVQVMDRYAIGDNLRIVAFIKGMEKMNKERDRQEYVTVIEAINVSKN